MLILVSNYVICFQLAVNILQKRNSVIGWGTMASNAIVAGNSVNNSVQEFFAMELNAFIIAATLNHKGTGIWQECGGKT